MLLPLAAMLAVTSLGSAQNEIEALDDKTYRLGKLDQIQITIFDEPDLSVAQRINGEGSVRIPLIGVVKVAGLNISKAETQIENAYVANEILKDPIVSIQVIDYAPKEISILGAVGSPGKLPFPTEASSLDIVDVISKVGGFSRSPAPTVSGSRGSAMTAAKSSLRSM